MAKYDEQLKDAPREQPVIKILEVDQGKLLFHGSEDYLPSDSNVNRIVEFTAVDLDMKLFRDVVRARTFMWQMQKWVEDREWSKKIIANTERRITWEMASGGYPPHPVYNYILHVRLWVADPSHAREFFDEAKRLHGEMSKEPGEEFRRAIELGKLIANAMHDGGGWRCKCGYMNHYNHRICAECLIPAKKTKRNHTLQS